jgi:hypothetical protein
MVTLPEPQSVVVNSELERKYKDAIMSNSRHSPGIFLRQLVTAKRSVQSV